MSGLLSTSGARWGDGYITAILMVPAIVFCTIQNTIFKDLQLVQ